MYIIFQHTKNKSQKGCDFMAKPRPATWLEKEMIYDAVKSSGEELPVDLKQCDFSRSGAGNLVCRFDGQQIFYLTKGQC